MTVYLVTCGEYEDYGVMGAFSSKEEAQPYADYLTAKGQSAVEIKEFELDVEKPKPVKPVFYCRFIPLFDGSFFECSQVVDEDEAAKEDGADCYYSYESAQDARTKAELRRAQYLCDNPNHGTSERDWRGDLTTC